MGMTGTGKSSFVKLFTEEHVDIGHSLESSKFSSSGSCVPHLS